MSELIKLIKTNLSHQSLNHNVYRIDYDRVLDKYSIDGKPGIEFPFTDFVGKLRGFFKSEARFSTDQAMKARSPRIAELAKEKIESNRLYCIFDDDNNIASFCQIVPCENRNDVYWVYLIYTPEEYRQQGLASDLIKFAENLAIQDRKTTLNITVYKDNINALNLYKSLGFVEMKGGDMSEKPKQHEIVYEAKEVPGSYVKRIGHALIPASLGTIAAGIITEGDPACMAISGLGSGLLTYLANPHLSKKHIEHVPTLREKVNDLSEGDYYQPEKKRWYKNKKVMIPLGVAGALYTVGRLS